MELQRPTAGRMGVAVLGVGNLGRRLVQELLVSPGPMELLLVSDVDAGCEGLRWARERGVEASPRGLDAVLDRTDVGIVYDASSAGSHAEAARRLKEAGKACIDLTPAATGPPVVPAVNLAEAAGEDDLNLLTCPAQAAVPVVHAIAGLAPALYAEVVSTIASASFGPGARRYIDEFTTVTARGLEQVAGARRGKSILILSPAEPPVAMRSTIYVVPDGELDERAAAGAVDEAVAGMRRLVPGCRLTSEPVVEERETPLGRRPTAVVVLEVSGSGELLDRCGNLDVAAAAARVVGEEVARRLLHAREVAV